MIRLPLAGPITKSELMALASVSPTVAGMDRPESGMRSKHGFELLQNLFAQCDQLFVIR